MIKLYSLKTGALRGSVPAHSTSAYLRLVKDHNELELPDCCQIHFEDPNDLFHFQLLVSPTDGLYRHGNFQFSFDIGHSYPFDPPRVACKTRVYHPNIDVDGNVCLNILREDWNPVLNLQSIICGLLQLFLAPNTEDPLHKEAAQVMCHDLVHFMKNLEISMAGGTVGGVQYQYCLRD
eukprot:m.164013 g.164013  ORF g.164013 m.164013 type:complete len:178 (-) comp15224_c0_seq3:198-731(-)